MPRPSRPEGDGDPAAITPELLSAWPLPRPDQEADKEARGRVLVVGGAPELPGAPVLAATAALRAGAGKVQIATCRSIALAVGIAVPESRVFAMDETADGGIDPSAVEMLAERGNAAQTMLIGPGLVDQDAVQALLRRLLPRVTCPTVVLDAEALSCGREPAETLHRFAGEAVLTPHAGEMAEMLGVDKRGIREDPLGTARKAAADLRAVVALKGANTVIAAPDGSAYRNRSGNVGLATSGSGDTLAGIVAGLAARGADALQAAVWGVFLHGTAGDRLAERRGQLGFLAREVLDEIPALMAELSRLPFGCTT